MCERKPKPIIVEPEPVRLNAMGRWYQHVAQHNGVVPMALDEFGRCARCVELGLWTADA
jgi:hypothetical protein